MADDAFWLISATGFSDAPGTEYFVSDQCVEITELYILYWSELCRRKLSPTLANAHYFCPDNAIGLVGGLASVDHSVKSTAKFGGAYSYDLPPPPLA